MGDLNLFTNDVESRQGGGDSQTKSRCNVISPSRYLLAIGLRLAGVMWKRYRTQFSDQLSLPCEAYFVIMFGLFIGRRKDGPSRWKQTLGQSRTLLNGVSRVSFWIRASTQCVETDGWIAVIEVETETFGNFKKFAPGSGKPFEVVVEPSPQRKLEW